MKSLPNPLQQIDRTYVRVGRNRLSYFSGCDYFRLSSDPRVIESLRENALRFGLNVAASRLTTGNHELYEELETELAEFFGFPSATLASSGYAANLLAAQALQGRFKVAFLDSRAHSSLALAASLLQPASIVHYPHRCPTIPVDDTALTDPESSRVLMTDGLFAHSGAVPPLTDYRSMLAARDVIWLDDTHGVGTLGARGRGVIESTPFSSRNTILVITLSKAFGTYGGAVLSSRKLHSEIIAKSHFFAGNTPPPLPLAAAALTALRILKTEGAKLRARLQSNMFSVRSQVARLGLQLPSHPGPIIGLAPTSLTASKRFESALLKARILPPLVRYPGGPPEGYFRFAVSSAHTAEQLDGLAGVIGAHAADLSVVP